VVLEHQPPCGRQHVGPVDPVIQGVEPELRLLLGLLTQLPSQLRDVRRQLDPGLHLRWDRGRVRGRGPAAFFRSGTVVPADLLTSEETRIRQGTFAPRALPRFLAPLSPSDSPPSPMAVLRSRRRLPPPLARGRVARRGRSGSWSIGRRPPFPPTPGSSAAAPARYLAVDLRLHQVGKVGRSQMRFHEAEMDSLALRLASSPSQAPTGQLPAPPLSQLHDERAISMVSPSQLTRSTRLTLTHPTEPNSETKVPSATNDTSTPSEPNARGAEELKLPYRASSTRHAQRDQALLSVRA